jgi:N-acetylglutamate synthase-like GNAT family acetyltransferase
VAASRLRAVPLAVWEREGLKAALLGADLPASDVDREDRLFWRFEQADDMPAGFGGLEIHGADALLHSIVTLPPLRRRGIGAAIIAMLEQEGELHGCRAIYLLTAAEAELFAGLGYAPCARDDAPAAIQGSEQFAALGPADATLMVKQLK